MQATTRVLRTVSAVFGLVFGLLAIAIPILGTLSLYIEPGQDGENGAEQLLLNWGGYGLTILSGIVFCSLVSALLLRYARRGRESRSFLRG